MITSRTEYEKMKADIIASHGVPIWDMGDPSNTSARLLKELLAQFRSDMATLKRQEKKNLTDIEKEFKKELEDVKTEKSEPMALTDTDLKPFTEEEKEIIIAKFNNTNLTSSDLNKLYPYMETRAIESLFRSGPYKALEKRIFNYVAESNTYWGLIKLLKSHHPQVTVRMAEHLGIMKNQESTVNVNKPIENVDPELMKKIKELGDNA